MSRIEDHALIGDGRSAALVDRLGSIDWLCWPRFDGDTCFAALLGGPGDGHWRVAPAGPVRGLSRRYRPGTAILETLVATDGGTVMLTDLMPWHTTHGSVIRQVACVQGEVSLQFELLARFDYGRARPWVRRVDDRWQLIMGPIALWLDGSSELDHAPATDAVVGSIAMRAGERQDFVLQCTSSASRPPGRLEVDSVVDRNEAFWRGWRARHAVRGPYAEQVLRSLITLKVLTDRDSGGVIAAPTSSLPECLGGQRNWDYRYGWLRDASFTLLALATSGFADEAAAWRDWLMRCIADHPAQLQIMYAIDGSRRMDEWTCDRLTGYEGATPVRFGNGAAKQLQIDVFGEVLNAFYQSRCHGLSPDSAMWELECRMIEHLADIWKQPGHGIWEMRGEPRVFTLSRVMAWVGVDRALKSAQAFDLPAPLQAWREFAHAIREDVLAHGFDAQRGSFTQTYGEPALDASLLLLPIYGFLPANDKRVVATVDAIERELSEGGLLLRYRNSDARDGLEGGEGVFIACNFWLAHVKVLQGRTQEAHKLMQRLLSCSNDLGLMAEEYDVSARRMCGNFPQTLSHVALINTVMAFDE